MVINICGYDVLIDEEDYERVKAIDWHFKNQNGYIYFRKRIWKNNKGVTVLLHRYIMGISGAGQIVDHISRNTLDNRKCNLRICTRQENSRNCKNMNTNKSGYKGVGFKKDQNKWRARISFNNKSIHLGYFDTPEEAYEAYCKASKKYHGEFGRIA